MGAWPLDLGIHGGGSNGASRSLSRKQLDSTGLSARRGDHQFWLSNQCMREGRAMAVSFTFAATNEQQVTWKENSN